MTTRTRTAKVTTTVLVGKGRAGKTNEYTFQETTIRIEGKVVSNHSEYELRVDGKFRTSDRSMAFCKAANMMYDLRKKGFVVDSKADKTLTAEDIVR